MLIHIFSYYRSRYIQHWPRWFRPRGDGPLDKGQLIGIDHGNRTLFAVGRNLVMATVNGGGDCATLQKIFEIEHRRWAVIPVQKIRLLPRQISLNKSLRKQQEKQAKKAKRENTISDVPNCTRSMASAYREQQQQLENMFVRA